MLLSTVYLVLLTNRVTLLLACESRQNGNESNEEYFPDLETMPPVIESQNASDILKTLFQNYDKRLRPRHGGEPLSIAVSLGFLSISNIEEENMEFTVDIYMRQIWNDTRLAFADRGSTLVLQDEALDNLWLPDTFFENAVHTFVQKETRTVVLFGDGLVVFSQRITVRATTLMDFRAYPMDKQVFKLDIMSYGRSIDQLHYPRIDVQLLNSEMSEFVVVNQSAEISAKELFMGCFDVLTVKFNLKRRVGYYVIRIYFPCTLCTVISWMAFWMDCRNIGDRGTVGITSLLTQLFLVGSINDSMPHVSYVKAADLFLIVSFVFSFLALLESLIVFKAASREKSTNKVLPREEKENETDIRMNDLTKQGETACPNKKADKKKRFSILQQPAGLTIDCFARAIFPLGYTVFIISYVSVYTI